MEDVAMEEEEVVDQKVEQNDNNKDDPSEVAPALIAVHPTHQSVAVAVGSDLRVFDLLQEGRPVHFGDDSVASLHKGSIRAIRYGAEGKYFLSAGDDKVVKIWTTNSWRCVLSVPSEKKVTAVAISNDGRFVCFADKFGVVWVVDLEGFHENQDVAYEKASPLLAHYCSIITSLDFSPDGRFIITADRDFKIRVTVFPKKPVEGAHEIQSFCLGHSEFVSCFAFVCSLDCAEGFLVSGSGDATVRLWDYSSGSLLDTCQVGTEEWPQQNGSGKQNGSSHRAVTGLCATRDGSSIAVAIQSLSGVLIMACNLSAKTLSIAKIVFVGGEAFIPTSLGSSFSSDLLWMVMGVSNLNGSEVSSLVRVRAIAGFNKINCASADHTPEPVVLADKDIPGGEKLLEKLQGNLSIDKEVFSAAAEAVKASMQNLLIKKQYTMENREYRKRGRNDRKGKRSCKN